MVISMVSCDDPGDNSVSVSVIGVIEETVFCERGRDGKSVVWDDSESGGRVCFVDEGVGFNELEEEEVRVETEDDDEVVNCDDVLKECVFSEESKGGVLKETRVTVGGGGWFEVIPVGGRSEKEKFREIGILSDCQVGKSLERARFRDVVIESAEDEVSGAKTEVRVLGSEDNKGNESKRVEINENDGEEVSLFDDWEGIERTELEKNFGAAMVFVGSKSNADRISGLGSDTQMQLYGLRKVAIEGPCCVPQPMALKVSARAKW